MIIVMRAITAKQMAMAAALCLLPVMAQAATLKVTTVNDELDAKCDQHCSLRDALRVAVQGDTIILPAGSFSPAQQGEFRIKNNVNMMGAGIGQTILDGKKAKRLLHVHPGFQATLSGITFQNGTSQESGGCLVNAGNLTIQDSQFLNCDTAKSGGAIMNRGTLKVINTPFNGNQAKELGGAIEQAGDALTLIHATFENNSAAKGGAVHTAYGNAVLKQTQMAKNSALEQGGGIWSGSGKTVGIEATTIQGNAAPAGADCLGVLIFTGNTNILGDPKGCTTLGAATKKAPPIKVPTIERTLKPSGIGGTRMQPAAPVKKTVPLPSSIKIEKPILPKGIGGGVPKPRKP